MGPNSPRLSSGTEARSAVEEVLRDQAERAKRRSQDRPPPKEHGQALSLVAVLLAVATVWAVHAPPSFLRPAPPPEPPPIVREAGLRMTVYVGVLRVRRFRDRTGHLPESLADVFEGPEDLKGLTYERLDEARFRLTGLRGESAVMYETGDDLGALVGDARGILERSR